MPRLIDADAVLDAIRDYFVELIEQKEEEYGADEIPFGVINPYLEMNKALRTRVKQIPTIDAEPVVRCEDCIYYGDHGDGEMACAMMILYPNKPTDYCSLGERKEDAKEE